MGVAGSDAAIEAAGVALMDDDLGGVPSAIQLARSTMRVIRQNVGFSIAVKVVFLALTLLGVTNLWLAVLADMGTSLLVTLNALRLTRPTWWVGANADVRVAHDSGVASASGAD
jgi:Cd2+/Zn2+-exporting ATPase